MLITENKPAEFLLGLPSLGGALLTRAKEIGASVLVSANAFSTWTDNGEYILWPDRKTRKLKNRLIRDWAGFRAPPLAAFDGIEVCLDSGGFVVASEYRNWMWTVDHYLNLCASRPWRWFASMDFCVEPEIATNESIVLDRISGTVRLNIQCLKGAEQRGIADRFMPVIQGWEVDHYLRCLDRMRWIVEGRALVGIGSMCRRHVEGRRGILQIIDALDRAIPKGVRLHLFGLKSAGMEELRGHPRIASFDSQAYGTAARQKALRGNFSKTNAYLADVMEDWHEEQQARLAKGNYAFRQPTGLLGLAVPPSKKPYEAAIERAEEELRRLHEDGEIDWEHVNRSPKHGQISHA